MNINKCRWADGLQLLVMVPHRDSRLPLRAWSASLFAAGLPGAWSFPWVVPIAVLHSPLPGEKLTSLAHSMRQQIDIYCGKFIAGTPAAVAVCVNEQKETLSVFGPVLNITLPDSFFSPAADALYCSLSPLILGAALVQSDTPHYPHGFLPAAIPLPPSPPVSFRAAALANMSLRPIFTGTEQNCFSFEWKIGKLHWLPKKVKSRKLDGF
ncbi:MAG: hypothetical protein FWG89_03890 [Treponema sp.]|nr:hypothetical protein [Treponema sp.]